MVFNLVLVLEKFSKFIYFLYKFLAYVDFKLYFLKFFIFLLFYGVVLWLISEFVFDIFKVFISWFLVVLYRIGWFLGEVFGTFVFVFREFFVYRDCWYIDCYSSLLELGVYDISRVLLWIVDFLENVF